MAKNINTFMPPYDEIVAVRALPVTARHSVTRLRGAPDRSWNIGRLQLARPELVREPLLLGIGAVLVDAAGVWSPAINIGTRTPETVDDVLIRVYGDQTSNDPSKRHGRAMMYRDTAAATDGLREEELLEQLQNVEPLTQRLISILDDPERPSWLSPSQSYQTVDRSAANREFGHTGIDPSRDGYLD